MFLRLDQIDREVIYCKAAAAAAAAHMQTWLYKS